MLSNQEFLIKMEEAFFEYIHSGSRSNKKLIILHGAISRDLQELLGPEYKVESLGVLDNKERSVKGRYMDKKVDITVSKRGKILGGIAVKYIMRNYSQNSNNYFENMLGETANIRCNKQAYFQFVMMHKYIPYFTNDGQISRTEEITEHYLDKYMRLSEDDPEIMMHTPSKTLLMLIDHEYKSNYRNSTEYKAYYSDRNKVRFKLASDKYDFDDSVIYNDYSDYIQKVAYYFKSR